MLKFDWLPYKCSLLLFVIGIANELKAQSFINGSFETWGIANSCEINITPDGWSNYSNGCIAFDEANFPICPTTIPSSASQGSIYARACAGPDWQGGEGVFQTISGLAIGQSYTVSFDYAGSNLYAGSDSVRWKLFIDDVNVNQTPFFSSSKYTWSTHTYSFTATQQIHKIGFRAYFIYPSVSGDGSAGIDNVTLSGSETGITNNSLSSGIKVYPKLMDNTVFISTEGTEMVELVLYDINSNELLKNTFFGSTSLNVECLPKGIYVCLIKHNNYVVLRETLIKM
jgi:hypothetical protein